MMPAQDLVFLIDVDNTLLDADRIVADFTRHLEGELGVHAAHWYWEIFATLREEVGHVDYLGARQRCRGDDRLGIGSASGLLLVAEFLLDYPFAERPHPARRYVMIDDKLRVLAAMKSAFGDRLTTLFPHQGHYALDPPEIASCAAADVGIACIGDLVDQDFRPLPGSAWVRERALSAIGGAPWTF